MRVIIQRVLSASVTVQQQVTGAIEKGLLVFAGFEDADGQEDISWIAGKLANLRIFDDSDGVMNLSCKDIGGKILLVSQFTLFASTKKGNRPSYIRASKSPVAIPLYDQLHAAIEKETGTRVQQGVFGADMQVQLINDGPVTIFIDSRNKE